MRGMRYSIRPHAGTKPTPINGKPTRGSQSFPYDIIDHLTRRFDFDCWRLSLYGRATETEVDGRWRS